MSDDKDNKPLGERRSGEDRRSEKPRRKEHRWEPGKYKRRSTADRRKKPSKKDEDN
jgi:hypothetical protein